MDAQKLSELPYQQLLGDICNKAVLKLKLNPADFAGGEGHDVLLKRLSDFLRKYAPETLGKLIFSRPEVRIQDATFPVKMLMQDQVKERFVILATAVVYVGIKEMMQRWTDFTAAP